MVIGAGHAGCEAALAAARLGATVAVVTLRLDGIAQMSCNPAIGGVGKGHLVREIDALGGAMAEIADATGIQFRVLNASRGPAVRSTRCQSDSKLYRQAMGAKLQATHGITLVEGEAAELLAGPSASSSAGPSASSIAGPNAGSSAPGIGGVRLASGAVLRARAVVVTTGTFLNGLCHVGEERFVGGRFGDRPATLLSDALRAAGLTLGRFKTGTTPRIAHDSIDWDRLEPQAGDVPWPRFSFDHAAERACGRPGDRRGVGSDDSPSAHPSPALPQIRCFLTHTTPETHALVRGGLDRSPLYRGIIKGLGPRYCPSVEDKIVRFADKTTHTIFLEPEGLDSDRVYPNGLSTSLPKDVQDAFLHSIPGLERARVLQYGYAVEYDFAAPTQLLPSLMTKVRPGLFLAGQINGTSGYEEAAAQGLVAGANAVRWLDSAEAVTFARHEAYLGVLVDDLVTKGVDEPYRMFTSRAEHRLTLREGNAEERLIDRAHGLGLVDDARHARALGRRRQRDELRARLHETRAGAALCARLGPGGESAVGMRLSELVRRPEIGVQDLLPFPIDPEVARHVEEDLKYSGYIEREQREIERLSELEQLELPSGLGFQGLPGLSRELQSKLESVRPATLGQASRIPGMTPAALSLVRIAAARFRPGAGPRSEQAD